jgi:hypothetical protein
LGEQIPLDPGAGDILLEYATLVDAIGDLGPIWKPYRRRLGARTVRETR